MYNVAFIVGTAAVLVTGLLVAISLRLPSRLDALLTWILLCVAEVVALALLLGWIGALRSGWLVLGSIVVLAVVSVAVRGNLRDSWARLGEQLRSLRGELTWANLRATPLAAFLALLASAQVAWSAFAGWALPPNGYDTQVYHLPAVAYWVQRGQIVKTPYLFFTNVYPLNGELTFAWPAALLHSDEFVNLGQIPFALLGAAATGVVARAVGARRSGAVIAASLFLLSPVVAQQMAVAYVDVVLAGSFLAAFAFVLRGMQSLGVLSGGHTSQRQLRLAALYLSLAGVAAGIGVGSKESGLLYLGILGLAVVGGLVAACVQGTLGTGPAVRLVVVLAVPVLLLGTFWYGRNLIDHQNPLYPWNVEVAGVVIEHGPQGDPNVNLLQGQAPKAIEGKSAPLQLARSWISEPKRGYSYDERLGGSGLLWILAAVPALVVFIAQCIRRRRDVLFLFLVPSVLILLLQPLNWWSRFTIFFLGAGFVALAAELENLRQRLPKVWRVAAVALAVIAFATFVVSNRRTVGADVGTVLDHATRSIDSRSAATALGTGDKFRWVSAIPPKATVATRIDEVPMRFVYPLFGRHFERDVVIVRGGDKASLLRQLRNAPHVRYVLAEAGRQLDRALRTVPGDYTLVRHQGTQRIYRKNGSRTPTS
jgi:Dolichyl-phosphate-mannose-protein mannosyltransferase